MRPTNVQRYCPCCWLNEPHRTERRAGKLLATEGLQEYLDSLEVSDLATPPQVKTTVFTTT